jgi:predicted RNase H-like nuclease (RuvC/YqgF family)
MKYDIKGTKYTRDLQNMAVLCKDKTEKMRYEEEIRKHKENQNRDTEINNLKNEMAEIKSLLQILVNRGQNG